MIEVTGKTLAYSAALIGGAVIFATITIAWSLGAFEGEGFEVKPYAALESNDAFAPWVNFHRELSEPAGGAKTIVATWLVNGQARTLQIDAEGKANLWTAQPGDEPQPFPLAAAQVDAAQSLLEELPPEIEPNSPQTTLLLSYYDGRRWQYRLYDWYTREPEYQALRAALGIR